MRSSLCPLMFTSHAPVFVLAPPPVSACVKVRGCALIITPSIIPTPTGFPKCCYSNCASNAKICNFALDRPHVLRRAGGFDVAVLRLRRRARPTWQAPRASCLASVLGGAWRGSETRRTACDGGALREAKIGRNHNITRILQSELLGMQFSTGTRGELRSCPEVAERLHVL